jgi:ribosomal protein S18
MKRLIKISGITLMLLVLISFVSCNKTYNTEEFYKKYENNNKNVVKTTISSYPYLQDTINKIEYKCVYYSKTIDFKDVVYFSEYLSNDYKLKYDGKFGTLFIKVYVKSIDNYYNEIVSCVSSSDNSTIKGETIITYYGFFDDMFVSQYIKSVEIIENYVNDAIKDNQTKSNENHPLLNNL